MNLEKKNRILLVTSSFPSHTDEMSKTFMSDLTHSLSSKTLKVFILCPHQSDLPFCEEHKSYTIIRFPYWFTRSGQNLCSPGGIITSVQNFPLRALQLIPFLLCQFLVAYRIIQKEQINLIHTHWIVPQGLIGAILKLLTGIPHITSIHGTDIHLVHTRKWAHPLIRFIEYYSDCITTNSSHTHRVLLDMLPSSEKTRIIPMGIYPEEFVRGDLNKPLYNRTILFVGRLINWKGISHLISAMEYVISEKKDVRLVIVGDGPEKSKLKNAAEKIKNPSSIFFLGRVDREKLLMWYQQADLFVLPSITHNNQTEGLGVVLLEAMASGVPVIGSNTGGIPDIIEDEVNGLLVTPGDPQALADAIIRILENPDLANRFREGGLKTVRERFSWDTIADQFVEVYHEVLKDKGNDMVE